MKWKWHHVVLAGIAVWMIASPWILGFAAINLALWNSVIAGTAIGLVVFWSALPPE